VLGVRSKGYSTPRRDPEASGVPRAARGLGASTLSPWSAPMPPDSTGAAARQKVAVTGASGFVGGHLLAALVARGHEVVALSRSPRAEAATGVSWAVYDPEDPSSARAAVDGCDAVVHLA